MPPKQKPKRRTTELALLLGQQPPVDCLNMSPPVSSKRPQRIQKASPKKAPVPSKTQNGTIANSSATIKRKPATIKQLPSPPRSTVKDTHAQNSTVDESPSKPNRFAPANVRLPPPEPTLLPTDSPRKKAAPSVEVEVPGTPELKNGHRLWVNTDVQNFFSPRVGALVPMTGSALSGKNGRQRANLTHPSEVIDSGIGLVAEDRLYVKIPLTVLRSPVIRTYGRKKRGGADSPTSRFRYQDHLRHNDNVYSVPSSPPKPTPDIGASASTHVRLQPETQPMTETTRVPLAPKSVNVQSSVRTSKFTPLQTKLDQDGVSNSKPDIVRPIRESKRKSEEEKEKEMREAQIEKQKMEEKPDQDASTTGWPRCRKAKRVALENPILISSDDNSSDEDELEDDAEFFPTLKARKFLHKTDDTIPESPLLEPTISSPCQAVVLARQSLLKPAAAAAITDDREAILNSFLRPYPRKEYNAPRSLAVASFCDSTQSLLKPLSRIVSIIPVAPAVAAIPNMSKTHQNLIQATERPTKPHVSSTYGRDATRSIDTASDFSLRPRNPLLSQHQADINFEFSSSPDIEAHSQKSTPSTGKPAPSRPFDQQRKQQNEEPKEQKSLKKSKKRPAEADPMGLLTQLLGGGLSESTPKASSSKSIRPAKKPKISHNSVGGMGDLSTMLLTRLQGIQSKKAKNQARRSIREAEGSFRKQNEDLVMQLEEESREIVAKEQKVQATIADRLKDLPIVKYAPDTGTRLVKAEWDGLLDEEKNILQLYTEISSAFEEHQIKVPIEQWNQDWDEVEEIITLGETVGEKIIQAHISAETEPGRAYKNLMENMTGKETEVAEILFADSIKELQKKSWGQVVWGLWEALNNVIEITADD